MKFKLGTKVLGAEVKGDQVVISSEPVKGGAKEEVSSSVGRNVSEPS
jgi:hypothetical protein